MRMEVLATQSPADVCAVKDGLDHTAKRVSFQSPPPRYPPDITFHLGRYSPFMNTNFKVKINLIL